MALARVTIWPGQSESGPRQTIVFPEQNAFRTELPISELTSIIAEHAWYWSPGWQAWEEEADQDREAGRYEVFESMDDFIEALDTH